MPAVHVAEPLLDYVQALVARSRELAQWRVGLSPRAGQGLVRAAQAWAFVAGRDAVLPEDVQAVLPAVATHRLEPRDPAAAAGVVLAAALLGSVAVPP